MTKQEYFDELFSRLRDYPDDFREEIREAFENHFEEGLASGESEDQIIENLGSVDDVMDNIRMMHMDDQRKRDTRSEQIDDLRTSINRLSSSLRSTIIGVSDLVADSVNEAMRNIPPQNQNAEEPTTGVIEEECTAVKIAGSGATDVKILRGDRIEYSFRPSISLFGPNNAKLETQITGDGVLFEMTGNSSMHLYLPSSVLSVTLDLTSGDTEIENITTDIIDGKSSSGDWELQSLRAREITIRSKSGDIECEDSSAESFVFETVSGDAEIRGILGSVSVNTTSGDIDVEKHSGESMVARTVSGDADIATSAGFIDASSVSGDIDLSSSGLLDDVNVSSVSGDVACKFKDDRYTAELVTGSGDIRCRTSLPSVKTAAGRKIKGGTDAKVYIKTASGDITVR